MVDRRGLGGHVDVEGRVVLGHALPNILDALQFDGGEGRGHAVDVERLGGDRVAVGIPCRAGERGAIEVEIDGPAGTRPRVERERLVECNKLAFHQALLHFGGGTANRCFHFLDHENAAVAVNAQAAVGEEFLAQAVGRLAIPAGHILQPCAELVDGGLA